jgi:hypothetical protein
MWPVWERRGMHTGFWRGKLKEGDDLAAVDIDGRIIVKWILKK